MREHSATPPAHEESAASCAIVAVLLSPVDLTHTTVVAEHRRTASPHVPISPWLPRNWLRLLRSSKTLHIGLQLRLTGART